MVARNRMKAGLIFLSDVGFDAADVARGLARAIREESYEVSAARELSAHEVELTVNGQTLRLALYRKRPISDETFADSILLMPRIAASDEEDFDQAAAVVQITVDVARDAEPGRHDDARRLLAWSAYLMAEALGADFLHWRQPPEVFALDLFLDTLNLTPGSAEDQAALAARTILTEPGPVPARASRKADRFPPLDGPTVGTLDREASEALDQAFAADMCVRPEDLARPGARARLRLATWFLSLSVALFSLPVAAALFVMHLLRGENLRTASRAMAAVGVIMVMQKTGVPMPGAGWLHF